jgi:ribonuclease T1
LLFQGKPVFFSGHAVYRDFSNAKFWQHLRRLVAGKLTFFVMALATMASVGLTPSVLARQATPTADSLETVPLASLPREAQETQRLILAGGPFRFDKDGSVFGNREQRLPRRPRGHYREYTVITPGSRDRGARRIVCAGEEKSAPETCYYTADHYNSFRRIQR